MQEMRETIPRLGHQQRKHQLEDSYGLRTNKEIALACGVHESTIDRDIAEWKASGEYDEWLDREWHAYLVGDDVDPRTKFLALTRLKERRMTRRSEIHQEVDIDLGADLLPILTQFEAAIKNADLRENNPRE